jgi:glycosyltransferase involved in cell wall biosynthesis
MISHEVVTKVAFGSVPKDGGTFTFYRNLRQPLFECGIDLRCVTVGSREAGLWEQEFADDGCVLLAENETKIKRQAQAFCQWCEDSAVDIVFGVNSVAILSALPHVPEKVRVMSRCANAFDHGYRITLSGYERLSRIVALAPRQVDDLVSRYEVDPKRISLIPNGTEPDRFRATSEVERGSESAIRLGFLGRLEHRQKGVLHLPGILRELEIRNVNYSLAVAGKGVHEAELRRRLQPYILAEKVRFVGSLMPLEIAGFLAEVDICLFPSHFEGSPNALIEAMMAGCVPVAWRLEGLTDFLIDDGVTGFLADVGDCQGVAEIIATLAAGRSKLQQASRRAALKARGNFSVERVVEDYSRLIAQVMSEPPPTWRPLPWNQFRIDPAFHTPWWRKVIPEAVKQRLRQLRLIWRMRTADG